MDVRQYFECLACGHESELIDGDEPKCAQCASGNGILSPVPADERERRAAIEK